MAKAAEDGETTVMEEADEDIPPETEEQALALNADGLRYWLREVLLDNVRLHKEIQLSKLARQTAAEMCRKGTPYVEPTTGMTAAAAAPVVTGKKSKKRRQEVKQFLDSDSTASGAPPSKISRSANGVGKDEPATNTQLPSQADAANDGSRAAANAPEAVEIPGLFVNGPGRSQPGSQVLSKQRPQAFVPEPRQPMGGHSSSGMRNFPADPRQHLFRGPVPPPGHPGFFATGPMGAPPPGWRADFRPGFGFPVLPPRPPGSAPDACPQQQGSLANRQLEENGALEYIAL